MDSEIPAQPSAKVDTTVPVSARIWNYWLGGKDYYQVDKVAGDQFAQVYAGIFYGARASRYFIARAVRYLATDAGIRIQQWRPEHSPFGPPKNLSNNLGGVARKVLSSKPDIQSSRTDAWVPAPSPIPALSGGQREVGSRI